MHRAAAFSDTLLLGCRFTQIKIGSVVFRKREETPTSDNGLLAVPNVRAPGAQATYTYAEFQYVTCTAFARCTTPHHRLPHAPATAAAHA